MILRTYAAAAPESTAFSRTTPPWRSGFIALYELTFDVVWIHRATELANPMIKWFWGDEIGAFFDTPARRRSADHPTA